MPAKKAAKEKEDKFSRKRLQELLRKWNQGGVAWMLSYRARCEIVFLIKRETCKKGCRSQFKNVVTRQLRPPLPYRTAHAMSNWYEVNVLHLPDPDAKDPREEKETGDAKRRRASKPKDKAKRIILILEGELAEAVNYIMKEERHPESKIAFTEAVLRYYRQLSTPLPPSGGTPTVVINQAEQRHPATKKARSQHAAA